MKNKVFYLGIVLTIAGIMLFLVKDFPVSLAILFGVVLASMVKFETSMKDDLKEALTSGHQEQTKTADALEVKHAQLMGGLQEIYNQNQGVLEAAQVTNAGLSKVVELLSTRVKQ